VAYEPPGIVTMGHVGSVARLNALYERTAEIVNTDVKEARRVWEAG
jgi:hypothetical protein